MIWQYGDAELLIFIEAFNLARPSIFLAHSYSKHSVNFLDVTVNTSEGRRQTKKYRKPTHTWQYLHLQSSHVRLSKTAIPCRQAYRFRRNCTNQADFDSQLRT